MTIDFYKALEDKFRGSRAFVKSRLEIYLPFIKPLLAFYPDAQTIDLGCGRGEWLELLNEHGFTTCGVDLNQDMLEPAKQAGLNVHYAEAISFLKQLPDQSQVVVSSFHLVEHIPFSEVETLVQEALRVLRPGGILIIETPNPENIMVGTTSFYLDPTHKNPLPPNLLALLPEHYGFKKIRTLRLQESSTIRERKPLKLIDVLGGVSPDCAIVAQKAAEEEIFCSNNEAFEQDHGITLEELASEYDKQFTNLQQEISSLTTLLCNFEVNRLELNKEFKTFLLMIKKSKTDWAEHSRQLEKLALLLQNSNTKCIEQEKEIEYLRFLLNNTGANKLKIDKQVAKLSQTTLISDLDSPERFIYLKKLTGLIDQPESERERNNEKIDALEQIDHYLNLDRSKQTGWKIFLPRPLFLLIKKGTYHFKMRKIYRKFNDGN